MHEWLKKKDTWVCFHMTDLLTLIYCHRSIVMLVEKKPKESSVYTHEDVNVKHSLSLFHPSENNY